MGPFPTGALKLTTSQFIDAAGVSATFLMTAPIAADLDIQVANEAWILGTYSVSC